MTASVHLNKTSFMNLFSNLLAIRQLVSSWIILPLLLLTGHCCLADPDLVLGVDRPPATTNAVVVTLDVDGDGEPDATYEHNAANLPLGDAPYYRVGFFLRNTAHLRFMRAMTKQIDFSAGQSVSAANQVYVSPSGDNYVILLGYDAGLYENIQWNYFDRTKNYSDAFFTNKTEVLIGFRVTSLDLITTHYGWVRLTRTDPLFITPFEVAGYDWNPLPDQPIAAGQPPVIPLGHEITPDGMRLSWPTQVAGWILESSEVLGPAAVWEPVPEASGTEALLPRPEGTRFYRLRRP
jgi:hypothetical protein